MTVHDLQNLPEVLTVEEVARILRISPKSVYACKEEIPGLIRIGRTIRFSRNILLSYLGIDQGRDQENTS